MALRGTFDDLSFAEVLQLLNLGRKTGMLIVRHGQQEAIVHLRDGEVVDAVADMIEGRDVVFRLLGWRQGEFEFTRDAKAVKHSIHMGTEALILEGMKRIDEWQQIEKEFSDLNVVLRVRADMVSEKYDDLEEDAKTLLRFVDARRDVSTIIRESGLEPLRALLMLTDMIGNGLLEKWQGPRLPGQEDSVSVSPTADTAADAPGIRVGNYFGRSRARE
jgi:hypothetical protein